jgi:hypothetical protein
LDKIWVPRPVGRPRRKPGSVAADKAYSNSLIRRYLRRRGISPTIPEKSDSQAARRRYIYLGTTTVAALVIWLRS